MTQSLDGLIAINGANIGAILAKKIGEMNKSERLEIAQDMAKSYERLAETLREGCKLDEDIGDYKISLERKGRDDFLSGPIFSFKLTHKQRTVELKRGSYDEIFNYYYLYQLLLKTIKK
jgi:hypothetical protein